MELEAIAVLLRGGAVPQLYQGGGEAVPLPAHGEHPHPAAGGGVRLAAHRAHHQVHRGDAPGQELYACACGIVHLRDDLLRSWSDEDEKIIRIGASTIPSAYILPQILPAFRREHPAPQFHVFQSDSEGIAEDC